MLGQFPGAFSAYGSFTFSGLSFLPFRTAQTQSRAHSHLRTIFSDDLRAVSVWLCRPALPLITVISWQLNTRGLVQFPYSLHCVRSASAVLAQVYLCPTPMTFVNESRNAFWDVEVNRTLPFHKMTIQFSRSSTSQTVANLLPIWLRSRRHGIWPWSKAFMDDTCHEPDGGLTWSMSVGSPSGMACVKLQSVRGRRDRKVTCSSMFLYMPMVTCIFSRLWLQQGWWNARMASVWCWCDPAFPSRARKLCRRRMPPATCHWA